jgi:hypothetical protein
MDYYEKAMSYLRTKIQNIVPLIFSDDIAWCKKNVKYNNAVFVERKVGTALDDMFLATQCKNIVLANSTFSWWCAWLNQRPDKICIAPKQWFKNRILNEQAYDLLPTSWITL